MKNNNLESIQDKVLNAIKEGKLNMKPKWYFVLMTTLRVLSIMIIFFAIIYLFNFIGLVTHERGFNILDLNPRGMRAFMLSVPWIIVMLSIFLLITFYVLVKEYSFIYRKPLVYSLAGIIFFVLTIGFIVHLFDAQFRFARFGEGPRTPILGPMHKYYRGEFKEMKRQNKFKERDAKPIMIPAGF